jgi:prophage DNA circulation protein
MPDFFTTGLQECSWRGISFPIELVGEKGSQTLAVHHRMDRDISQVEATGRQSYTFTVKAFFLTGLSPGQNESWSPSDLFPATWIKMKAALEDRTVGVFAHPMYGNVNCIPVDWSVQYISEIRSGVIAEIEFIETIDETAPITLQVSVISSATSAASTMDSQLSSFGLPPDSINTLGQGSTSNAVSYILAQTPSQAGIYINIMSSSVFSFVSSVVSFPDSYAPILDTSYQLLQALQALLLQFQTQQLTTSVYTTANTVTLATIANFTNNSIDNIMRLNPGLVSLPLIPPNTPILYYVG